MTALLKAIGKALNDRGDTYTETATAARSQSQAASSNGTTFDRVNQVGYASAT
ncbi:MAG: hypothetical protein KME42_21595 [Tildeniella nuda ZEHNDER 1965/U140]|nr:hypothetical protein [Tildeniella nuda ZEHNDER 1965/U140]